MSKNQYKQATRYFGIPVLGWEDGIWPELELLKWQMLENLLLSAMKGNTNAIFREGNYKIQKERNGTYTVMLSATGNEPALQGSVGGAYFDAPATIIWEGLQEGSDYYLYIKGSTKTFYDAKNIVAVASTTRLVSQHVTLAAKANLRGDNPEVDLYPSGKVNARELASHVMDFDNPHGDKVSQDEILIRNHLAIGDGNDADLEFDVNGEITHIPLSKVVASLKITNTVVDFKSGGKNGVTLKGPGKIKFANVTGMETGAGEVIICFYGSHPEVKSPNQIIVKNSGGIDVAMKAMIVCE